MAMMPYGPPGGMWVFSFNALHDATRDLPEDFFERVQEGVDPETRTRLLVGFKVGRAVVRTRTWAWLALVVGLVAILVAIAIPVAGYVILLAGAGWILSAVLLHVYAFALTLAHRQEIHSFLAFVESARGSSLGRDLS